MVKYFVYMVSDRIKKNIQVGFTTDIKKSMNFYGSLMSVFLDQNDYINRLVHLEYPYEQSKAIERMNELFSLNLYNKISFIKESNPEFIDLTSASNYEF